MEWRAPFVISLNGALLRVVRIVQYGIPLLDIRSEAEGTDGVVKVVP